ncbi:MAG: hypothetical protein V3T72_09480, partial [Thermoanaerobaculia bacterium]
MAEGDTRHEIRLHELVERALDLSPAARRAFLETECGGDGALVEEALAFLEHEEEIGGFLEAPAVDAAFQGPDFQDPWEDSYAGDTTRVSGGRPPAAPEERTTDTLATGIDADAAS